MDNLSNSFTLVLPTLSTSVSPKRKLSIAQSSDPPSHKCDKYWISPYNVEAIYNTPDVNGCPLGEPVISDPLDELPKTNPTTRRALTEIKPGKPSHSKPDKAKDSKWHQETCWNPPSKHPQNPSSGRTTAARCR